MFNLLEAVNRKGSNVWFILFQLFLLKMHERRNAVALCFVR